VDGVHAIPWRKGRLVLEGRQQPGLSHGLDFEIAIRQSADARAGAGKLILSGNTQRLIAPIPEQARCLAVHGHLLGLCHQPMLRVGEGQVKPPALSPTAPSNESWMPLAASVPSIGQPRGELGGG
jgi:hypothetical protein